MSEKNGKAFELPQGRTALLVFDADSGFAGAEVEVLLDVPLELFFTLQESDERPMREVMSTFGDEVLLTWNITKKGKAIPATGSGMAKVSPAFAQRLVEKFMEVVANPPAPLSRPSSDGNGSEEESEKTVSRSPSPSP